jgi:cold-inducible RNA-binding protein
MKKKLFIGNLPYEATETELQQWFADGGIETESISLQVDQLSGQPRGFAYVVVSPTTARQAVRRCNGRAFGGRTLIVNEAPLNSQEGSDDSTFPRNRRY